jgi:hypothetical protein
MADNFWTDEKVIEFIGDCGVCLDMENSNIRQLFEKQMEVFKRQQQSKRDWEVLTMVDGSGWVHPYDRTDIPCCDKCKIHSVKRLSDGEVFSVGDELNDMDVDSKIDGFTLNKKGAKGQMWVSVNMEYGYGCDISIAKKKVEKPKILFTTQEGVACYKKDTKLYSVCPKGIWETRDDLRVGHTLSFGGWKGWLHFYDKEARDGYIQNNKPILSLDDLLGVWNDDEAIEKDKDYYRNARLFKRFEKLAQDKLNKK